MHPADHDTLRGQVDRLTKELLRIGPAEIVSDPEITSGGCRIETVHGVVDQQFESQLSRIVEELTRGNEG